MSEFKEMVAEQKKGIEQKFNTLSMRRDILTKSVNEITTELVRLQGEHRSLVALEQRMNGKENESDGASNIPSGGDTNPG